MDAERLELLRGVLRGEKVADYFIFLKRYVVAARLEGRVVDVWRHKSTFYILAGAGTWKNALITLT